jgi:hypothetical protein
MRLWLQGFKAMGTPRRIAYGDDVQTVIVDADVGMPPIRVIPTNVIRAVAWSPDGTRLATGTPGGILKIWDANDGSQIVALDVGVDLEIGIAEPIVWSPDGTRIAACNAKNNDENICVWSGLVARGVPHKIVMSIPKMVVGMAWNTNLLAVCSSNGGCVNIWNVVTDIKMPDNLHRQITAFDWSPDGSEFAVAYIASPLDDLSDAQLELGGAILAIKGFTHGPAQRTHFYADHITALKWDHADGNLAIAFDAPIQLRIIRPSTFTEMLSSQGLADIRYMKWTARDIFYWAPALHVNNGFQLTTLHAAWPWICQNVPMPPLGRLRCVAFTDAGYVPPPAAQVPPAGGGGGGSGGAAAVEELCTEFIDLARLSPPNEAAIDFIQKHVAELRVALETVLSMPSSAAGREQAVAAKLIAQFPEMMPDTASFITENYDYLADLLMAGMDGPAIGQLLRIDVEDEDDDCMVCLNSLREEKPERPNGMKREENPDGSEYMPAHHVFACGHRIHHSCFATQTASGYYRCPKCNKLIVKPWYDADKQAREARGALQLRL